MRTFLCLTCVLIMSATTLAQKSEPVSAVTTLAETERAFAKTSKEKGTREAFLAFIAEDGTLFRPMAVKGKQWLLEHHPAPSNNRPLLAWQPSYAEVARAGDLGYTFGPWEFKKDIKDEKPVAYGHFVTVWQKQSDGSWKFVVDLGIQHSQLTAASKDWQHPVNYKQTSWKPEKIDLQSARTALVAIDREFSNSSAANDQPKSLSSPLCIRRETFSQRSLSPIGRRCDHTAFNNLQLSLNVGAIGCGHFAIRRSGLHARNVCA